MVTLYDVARQAGVSIATVSRVLHGQEPVRESTRDRVRAAIKELGYVPDGAAQSLARSRKDVIGLVCVEHTGLNPNQYDIESMSLLFYDEVMRGVEALIRERHWSLLITYLREDENPGRLAPRGGRAGAAPPAGAVGQGRRAADRRGRGPGDRAGPARPAAAGGGGGGRRGDARRRRGGGRQLVGRVRAGAPSARSTTAGVGCTTSTGRRRRPTRRPGGWPCRRSSKRMPGARLVGAHSGRFSVQERRGRGGADAGRLRRPAIASCPTRSSARTTRWRSACSARWRRAGSGCRKISRLSVLMTYILQPCVTRR